MLSRTNADDCEKIARRPNLALSYRVGANRGHGRIAGLLRLLCPVNTRADGIFRSDQRFLARPDRQTSGIPVAPARSAVCHHALYGTLPVEEKGPAEWRHSLFPYPWNRPNLRRDRWIFRENLYVNAFMSGSRRHDLAPADGRPRPDPKILQRPSRCRIRTNPSTALFPLSWRIPQRPTQVKSLPELQTWKPVAQCIPIGRCGSMPAVEDRETPFRPGGTAQKLKRGRGVRTLWGPMSISSRPRDVSRRPSTPTTGNRRRRFPSCPESAPGRRR